MTDTGAAGVDLTALPGVVIHQHANIDEAVMQAVGFDCWERRNNFSIKPLPAGVTIVANKSDSNLWQPTFEEIQSLPTIMTMSEKSDSLTRCCFACWGCRGIRPLELIIFEQGQETAKIEKPCKCGSCIGCPLQMTLLKSDGTKVGYVHEYFTPYCGKCFDCCCRCNYYHRVYTLNSKSTSPSSNQMDRGGEDYDYELNVALCCCGVNNNCCGGTCCVPNAIYGLYDPDAKLVGNVQKMYAKAETGGCKGGGRMLGAFDTFAILFPEGSTQQERMMLIASIMQAEFQLFEQD